MYPADFPSDLLSDLMVLEGCYCFSFVHSFLIMAAGTGLSIGNRSLVLSNRLKCSLEHFLNAKYYESAQYNWRRE